jgi:excisionase family DNA binding protein
MEEWITTAEAATLTGYTEEHVRRLARDGTIATKKWGRTWMIDKSSLMVYRTEAGRNPKEPKDS